MTSAPIDADGYVTIVDRKKELIINAAGKNMSPTNIENTIKSECPRRSQRRCDRRFPTLQRRADRAGPRDRSRNRRKTRPPTR
ncbi:hypothetical protein ACFWBG_24875 [Nocardia salmonicida]|uniref:hypothetical protein n=1 Tax=Nocardia salmonicida TaxID=53431 RepID=UPI00366C10A2